MSMKAIAPLITLIGTLLLALLLSPLAHATGEATVGGRVFTAAGPFKGARVYAYAQYGDIRVGRPPLASADCDERGSYGLKLPPGKYYFVARGALDGKDFFAFHGNNPTTVGTEDDIWIPLLATEVKKPVSTAGATALAGVVTYKGQPLQEGEVTLYKPDGKFRGPGIQTETVAADGTFRFTVPPGSYVAVAKKKNGTKGNRPLKKGELYCYYALNPLELKENSVTRIEIPCYPKDDRDAFVDMTKIKPGSFKTIDSLAAVATKGIRGRVTNPDGSPASGVLVAAFRAFKPNFLTHYLSRGADYWAKTGTDGTYLIPVDSSGDYYIVARETLGGIPQQGELYGLYNGTGRHAVTYEKSSVLDNIDITVTTMVDEELSNTPTTQATGAAPTSGPSGITPQADGQDSARKSASSEPTPKTGNRPEDAGRNKEGSDDRWVNSQTTEGNIQYLEADSRKEWLKPEEIVKRLFIRPGETIADLGSGTGTFSTLMARETGTKGLVYAVDIEPEMVDYLQQRAAREGLDNIRNILGTPDDPRLPAASADLVLMFNMYPALDNRAEYLTKVSHILKKNGRLALLSYTMVETPDGRPPMHRRVSRDRAVQEAGTAGLKLQAEYFFLPYHYFLIFEKR